jgi:uncharacterized protein
VTLIDVNLLLYAYDSDSPGHTAARCWLEELFASDEVIGLPWITIWAFVRLSTNPRVRPNPKSVRAAFRIVREWLAQPGVLIVEPGPRHLELLEGLAERHQAAGSLLTDAALAALALENGATLASSDQDFRRFPELRWVNPLAT